MTFRLLYVGVDLYFTNPTSQLIPSVLDQMGEVVFFGPGYVSSEILEAGLERFIDSQGPFDFAVTTELLALSAGRMEVDLLVSRIRRLYSFSFQTADLFFLPKIAFAWQKLQLPRLLFLLQDDLYNWSQKHVDLAISSSDIILGNGLENIVRVDEMSHADTEPWAQGATDNFINLLIDNPERFASFPLFVSENEICRDPHFSRKRRWAVPGVQYHARKVAADQLRKASYVFRRNPPSLFIHKFAEILGRMPHSGVLLAQHLFRRDLESSVAVFTCGSVLRQPIRKFFEIPAAGALLVCEPCAGLVDYGFADKVSSLNIQPENICEVDEMISSNPDSIQEIARRGQMVVIRNHTVNARASQLGEILCRLDRKAFFGARWKEGKYIFTEFESKNTAPKC